MSFLKKLKSNTRDKSRDNFYKHLITLGIDASLAERANVSRERSGRPSTSE